MAMTDLVFRDATLADIPALERLMEEDEIGTARDPVMTTREDHARALAEIDADANNRLFVAERGGEVVGTYQLTLIPGIARRGNWRAVAESVRVARSARGGGIGAAMMEHAIALCRVRGCHVVQLTSDLNRPDAHRFYRRLGFVATHAGFKLML